MLIYRLPRSCPYVTVYTAIRLSVCVRALTRFDSIAIIGPCLWRPVIDWPCPLSVRPSDLFPLDAFTIKHWSTWQTSVSQFQSSHLDSVCIPPVFTFSPPHIPLSSEHLCPSRLYCRSDSMKFYAGQSFWSVLQFQLFKRQLKNSCRRSTSICGALHIDMLTGWANTTSPQSPVTCIWI